MSSTGNFIQRNGFGGYGDPNNLLTRSYGQPANSNPFGGGNIPQYGSPGGGMNMLESLGSSLGGGLLSSLGDKAGEWLGLTPDISKSSSAQAIDWGLNKALDYGQRLTGESMYNAMGDTGKSAVMSNVKNALNSLTNSARAQNNANAMERNASDVMQGANRYGNLAMDQTNQRTGGMVNAAMGTAKASGAGPAATAAMLGSLGKGISAGNADLATQLMGAYNQSLGQSEQMRGGAQNVLQSDLGQRFQQNVQPYMANLNQGVSSLANNITNEANQSAMDQARTNPLAGIAGGMGMLGSGGLSQLMSLWG